MIYKDESFRIIGAAMEVHKILGNGFFEQVYQDALEYEFQLRSVPYEREKCIQIPYKGIILNRTFVPDFICFEKVIFELKAVAELSKTHEAQLLNYLKASGFRLGFLVNFGKTYLDYKRFVY